MIKIIDKIDLIAQGFEKYIKIKIDLIIKKAHDGLLIPKYRSIYE